ncbi:SynChlorMet cassette protein ScmC [candidate division WOR-3 bacterium]|nr:SynChlorMet cassette protein ScmC [candidate division WOR-3 bacterium]
MTGALELGTTNQKLETKPFGLALANGHRWLIRAADDEAGDCIRRLAQVMQLRDADHGREVLIALRPRHTVPRFDIPDEGPLQCWLPPNLNPAMGVIQMTEVARRISLSDLKHGSLLIHGALARYRGSGIIMAGRGGIGKSTASSRLPEPWHSLSDDTTMVVRDQRGQYWAHPWPTWSRFRDGGPGGTWAVERAVPLRAVFFLGRAPSDRLAPIGTLQATALLVEAQAELAYEASLLKVYDPSAVRALFNDGFRAAVALARAVPAFSLELSLDGRFWELIEEVLGS